MSISDAAVPGGLFLKKAARVWAADKPLPADAPIRWAARSNAFRLEAESPVFCDAKNRTSRLVAIRVTPAATASAVAVIVAPNLRTVLVADETPSVILLSATSSWVYPIF